MPPDSRQTRQAQNHPLLRFARFPRQTRFRFTSNPAPTANRKRRIFRVCRACRSPNIRHCRGKFPCRDGLSCPSQGTPTTKLRRTKRISKESKLPKAAIVTELSEEFPCLPTHAMIRATPSPASHGATPMLHPAAWTSSRKPRQTRQPQFPRNSPNLAVAIPVRTLDCGCSRSSVFI